MSVSLTVMTFNLLEDQAEDSPNSWEKKEGFVYKRYNHYSPMILCTQQAMEEDTESRKRNSNGKPIRRFHKRKKTTQQDHSSINIAQARREIVNAFHLHRSSSSSCDYGSQYCSSLLESLPLPQPTWSTTPPSVLATPPPPPMEALEFEWAENLASSYTWWLGFLKTLDGNNNTPQVVSKYPFEEEIVTGMGYGLKIGDPLPCLDGNDDHQSSSLDAWLTIPTVEDQGEMMM